jgi:hypothetical protein
MTYGPEMKQLMTARVIPFRPRNQHCRPMKRTDMLLAALAAAERRSFHPAHLQKSLFLIDYKLPRLFDQRYDFRPYDKEVYVDADALQRAGLVSITRQPGEWYRTYRVTAEGLRTGHSILAAMPPQSAQFVRQIVGLVTSLPFRDFVSAIYRAFPELKVNGVFKEAPV